MPYPKIKIKKGDTVAVIAGKDRGKSGKVLLVDPKNQTVIVENLNVYKKHRKPRRQGEKGEIIDVPRPLHVSNVAHLGKGSGKPVRREKVKRS